MPTTHPLVDRLLYWAPRVLSILFAAFISVFALDVFNEGYAFWHTVLALMVHLIPTIIIVAMLIVAWTYEGVGGMVFILLAAWYLADSWSRFPHSSVFVIAGPLLVTGGLFLCDWLYRAKHHAA